MRRDSLLFQQHHSRLDLRVLRFYRQRNRDLVDSFVGDDARQFFDRSDPGRAFDVPTGKSAIVVYIAKEPVSQVLTEIDLGRKSPAAGPAANQQESFDVMAAPA